VIPVLIFLAVTSTPGINAPLASETVPLNPALTWAKAGTDARTSSIETATNCFFIVLSHLPAPATYHWVDRAVRNERGNISENTRMQDEIG
jgi:hypothetical protein